MEKAGMINAYDCDRCGKATVTRLVDDGTTPMLVGCRESEGCKGVAESRFYAPVDLSVDGDPKWEWYKPRRRDKKRLSLQMQEHVRMGGLVLRRIDNDKA